MGWGVDNASWGDRDPGSETADKLPPGCMAEAAKYGANNFKAGAVRKANANSLPGISDRTGSGFNLQDVNGRKVWQAKVYFTRVVFHLADPHVFLSEQAPVYISP